MAALARRSSVGSLSVPNSPSRAKGGVGEGQLSYDEVQAECRRLPAGGLWEDRSWSGNVALYKPRSATKYNGGEPIRWLRPTEMHGADASGASTRLIRGGMDAGDVEQGELGDCYLLGAMSAIAAATDDSGVQGELFYKLLRNRDGADDDLKKGFCTFLLYKFGTWAEVTVDTLLPCDAAAKPLFAHGKDPNELWVPLLEKAELPPVCPQAYAKLHGSYEALDGGSVTAALVDLTGGIAETLDLSEEDELQELYDGSMWKRMVRYASGTAPNCFYLLGAALAKSDVQDDGHQEEVQMTDANILVNHAYTLLEAREVPEGVGEKVKLLKLRNPWGMREWSGPWSDGSDEWKTKAGQKAKADLQYVEADDGTFYISWDDFQAHFNRIYVCRVAETCDGAGFSPEQARQGAGGPPGCWCKYELDGEWTADSAGGCFNFPSWRTNPQYELVVGQETNAFFILMQPDPRMDKGKLIVKGEGDEGGPKYDHKIGMYVMKGHEQFSRKVIFDSEEIEGDDVLDSTPYMEYREVHCNTMDEEDEPKLGEGERVVLCPSTFKPNKLGKFRIIVLTESALLQPPRPLAPLHALRQAGRWEAGTAGGSRNCVTWRKNTQYQLKLSRPSRVSVLLMRHDEDATTSDKPLGAKKKKAKNPKRKKADKIFFIGFVVVRPLAAQAGKRIVHVEDEAVLEKTSYSPNFEVSREFHSGSIAADPNYSDDCFVIVPTTFKPNIVGEYDLVVYTDDASATLEQLPKSTWHETSARGEWVGRSAGGSRNHPSWVCNPLYSLQAQRDTAVHIFLRQPAQPGEAAVYEGIGFYVARDEDESLDLSDVLCESGFRKQEEVHATIQLVAGKRYLLVPMTYRKGVHATFEIEISSDQPLAFAKLSEQEAHARRSEQLEDEAVRTIIQSWARTKIRRELRKGPAGREEARRLMDDFFRMPSRHTDEGYLDINLALNALESAFIQLTGKGDAKGSFFPRMRERLRDRNHKVADYDVCL